MRKTRLHNIPITVRCRGTLTVQVRILCVQLCVHKSRLTGTVSWDLSFKIIVHWTIPSRPPDWHDLAFSYIALISRRTSHQISKFSLPRCQWHRGLKTFAWGNHLLKKSDFCSLWTYFYLSDYPFKRNQMSCHTVKLVTLSNIDSGVVRDMCTVSLDFAVSMTIWIYILLTFFKLPLFLYIFKTLNLFIKNILAHYLRK